MTSRSLAWLPAATFSFLGLLAFLRARKRQQKAHSPLGDVSSPPTGRHGRVPGGVPQSQPKEPTEWSLDALKQLEWNRFETLCVWYYEAMGFTVTTISHGADGGIDATLYKQGMSAPIAVVQCKAWRSPIKVETVRALGGSMHANKVQRGVFWSLTGFVGRPVKDYAAEAGIQLLDGAGIVERIRALDHDKQAALLAKAFEGDYRTPTCAACGVKLVEREGKGRLFWGCQNFSKGCRITLPRAA
ncbi:restriction endonuclease [Cupriavidus pauculus]|uniref:restriction endonuclease n=1 Tax=Cupriavidus pauculus TaxID=82633 RepID=UPI00208BEC2C|nr:restriction endonuclease [Cupriavidus pauculus]GJG97648.1 DNA topoisomerase [Cupriavidus pauculus]